MSDEYGDPISYQALQPGTRIVSSDHRELGTVERVIDNPKEHIFDGIVMRSGDASSGSTPRRSRASRSSASR